MKGIYPMLGAILVTAATAGLAQDQLTPSSSTAEDATAQRDVGLAGPADFAVVLRGLADEMRTAAEHLRARDERRPATEALDRSLHLAEFGTQAFGIDAEGSEGFRRALAAVRDARHALQNGRPEDCARTLAAAAQALGNVDVAAAAPAPLADHADEVTGLKVLDERGHSLGELTRFEQAEAGPRAIVESGGFLWWGGEAVVVPAEVLLGAENFVVWPFPVGPEGLGPQG